MNIILLIQPYISSFLAFSALLQYVWLSQTLFIACRSRWMYYSTDLHSRVSSLRIISSAGPLTHVMYSRWSTLFFLNAPFAVNLFGIISISPTLNIILPSLFFLLIKFGWGSFSLNWKDYSVVEVKHVLKNACIYSLLLNISNV